MDDITHFKTFIGPHFRERQALCGESDVQVTRFKCEVTCPKCKSKLGKDIKGDI